MEPNCLLAPVAIGLLELVLDPCQSWSSANRAGHHGLVTSGGIS